MTRPNTRRAGCPAVRSSVAQPVSVRWRRWAVSPAQAPSLSSRSPISRPTPTHAGSDQLRGGCDGLSMVVPVGDPHFITSARPNIGVSAQAVHQLDSVFGLHPALAPLVPLPFWRRRHLQAVHAVAQADPTRSHFEAMEQMERAAPDSSLHRVDRAHDQGRRQPWFAPRSRGGYAPTIAIGDVRCEERHVDRVHRRLHTLRRRRPGRAEALDQGVDVDVRRCHGSCPSRTRRCKRSDERPCGRDIKPRVGAHYVWQRARPRPVRRRPTGQGRRRAAGRRRRLRRLGHARRTRYLRRRVRLDAQEARRCRRGACCVQRTISARPLSGVTVVTLCEFGPAGAPRTVSGGVDHGHGNAVLLLGGGMDGGHVYGRWPGLAVRSAIKFSQTLAQ